MNAKPAAFARIMYAQKNKNTQRQPSAISGQMRNDAVAEPFSGEAVPAAEKYEQADHVDRQPPGKLQEIEEHPGPAFSTDCLMDIMFFPVHMQRLFHPQHFAVTEYRIAHSFQESK
ncbi:MAG: hypothetical protein HDT18_04115 [Oscillibacter sp.]|nr:hypothetical protein [Oscillibacter sp.]